MGPDVVVAEHLPDKGDDRGVLEDLRVDEGLAEGDPDVVAAPAPARVFPLPFDAGVAHRLPGFEDAVDLRVRDQVLEHGEPVDAELEDLGVDVVFGGGSHWGCRQSVAGKLPGKRIRAAGGGAGACARRGKRKRGRRCRD